MTGKTWFVTGASQGIGFILVKKLLEQGYNVVATTRNEKRLSEKLGPSQNLLCVSVDLHSEESVRSAIEKTIDRFRRIDVIVNNAGYAYQGIFETMDIDQLKENFEINVFGVVRVVKAALPHLRKQKSGYILNISSIVGFFGGIPGYGSYTGSKFALSGLSEVMSSEFADINVGVTILYPGPFRTGFLEENQKVTKDCIDDYQGAKAVFGIHDEMNKKQPGDPEKLTDYIIELSKEEKPPLHVFAGKPAFEYAQEEIDNIKRDIERTKDRAIATDY